MENTLQAAVPCSVSCFRSFDKHMLWPPRYLEDFSLQITKIRHWAITLMLMDQSVPGANIPPGNFLEAVKNSVPGQNFSAKARAPPGKKAATPREYLRRYSQPFLLIGVEILEFCGNQTFKKIGSLSNYSLVIPFSFSLSTIFDHFKAFPSFETDFVTGKQQQMTDQFEAEKCLHAVSTDNLVLMITDKKAYLGPNPKQFGWYKSLDPG